MRQIIIVCLRSRNLSRKQHDCLPKAMFDEMFDERHLGGQVGDPNPKLPFATATLKSGKYQIASRDEILQHRVTGVNCALPHLALPHDPRKVE